MNDPTPNTFPCRFQREAADPVAKQADRKFHTWPGNLAFTAPLAFNPKTLAELSNAILEAEAAGHPIRATGSAWSFSDAILPGTSQHPGAIILTEHLNHSLEVGTILAAGESPTYLHHVEAGMKASDFTRFLSDQGQMIEAGGASGQSLGGMVSTSTHSSDCTVPPFVDYIQAIHLVGAGAVEHWIERDQPITDPAKLLTTYPCLAQGNVHYDTELFNAALVAAGSIGVIYALIIRTVATHAVMQHRFATTWEHLLAVDPTLAMVIDGSYMESFPPANEQAGFDVMGNSYSMTAPFTPNEFAQVVINPYPYYSNDHTISNTPERFRIGEHLCFVTNRARYPDAPDAPNNPPAGTDPESIAKGMLNAAFWSLNGVWNPDALTRFSNFTNGLGDNPDLSTAAAMAVDFLADYWPPATISAMIHYVLQAILPVGDRWDTNLSEVLAWNDEIKGFGFEAAFPIPGAIDFIHGIFALIDAYAAQAPKAFVGGYLSLRIVGKATDALLGTQRWSPTGHVEYIGVAGSRGLPSFMTDLQKLAIGSGGILHLGLQNDALTAADLLAAQGQARITAFRRARALLSNNGTLTTFDNEFTDRLGLSALRDNQAEIAALLALLLRPDDPEPDNSMAAAMASIAELLLTKKPEPHERRPIHKP